MNDRYLELLALTKPVLAALAVSNAKLLDPTPLSRSAEVTMFSLRKTGLAALVVGQEVLLASKLVRVVCTNDAVLGNLYDGKTDAELSA